jgi:hypothetical protein
MVKAILAYSVCGTFMNGKHIINWDSRKVFDTL